MNVVTKNSPNQSSRLGAEVRIVVVHTPEGTYSGAIGTCMNPANEVSYHRLYRKDGKEATQLVPFDRKAWHALSYNSFSIGLSIEGFAAHFSLADPGTRELALGVAECLARYGLKPQHTTDPVRGGFCRHGDLQSNRTDPTPDMAEWAKFVLMVETAYKGVVDDADEPWPVPMHNWFWLWARWRLGEGEYARFGPSNKDHRPNKLLPFGGPGQDPIPGWAWKRLEVLLQEREAPGGGV